MPIHPLPQFEADLEADRKAYEALQPPKTIVVRYGVLKMVGEFPYDGQAKPGCGSKLVVRTSRGTELGEMLTSTCPNAGCSKSVTRKEMLQYIENSGGRDYPFSTEGRVLRIATPEDLEAQARLEQSRHGLRLEAKRLAENLKLRLKIVDAEPILGGERLIFYYTCEDRLDVRELLHDLSNQFRTRIDLRHVGARDEARITADYEKCGQHCCCKTFLKVLKPISMRSAKVQKATLDPLKISGRCGRLMCCLRYEDQTYDELRKRLPKRKTRVGTPEGDGWVVDTQILTQLVLVQLEQSDKQIALPVENLAAPAGPPPQPGQLQTGTRPPNAPLAAPRGPRRDVPPSSPPASRPDQRRPDQGRPPVPQHGPSRPGTSTPSPGQSRPAPGEARPPRQPVPEVDDLGEIDDGIEDRSGPPATAPGAPGEGGKKRRRRRRRNRRPPGAGDGQGGPPAGPSGGPPPPPPPPPPSPPSPPPPSVD
ncbi:MAG: hypothetical protein KF678_12750 [Phycisphaeraceae bacterium]|nr:hypothetical protein [Phycisphaeraceae bacterium]